MSRYRFIKACLLSIAGAAFSVNLMPLKAKDVSWGEQRLTRIVEKEERLFRNVPPESDRLNRANWEGKVHTLASEYQAFTLENPESVEGFIFMGKFLRKMGERKAAYIAFAKANRLDPNIAAVKQQIGNYLAEEGSPELAIGAFLEAIELSPETAVYHYQLGELVHIFRYQLLINNISSGPALDRQMLEAFKVATKLDPNTREFAWRHAEAYYDVTLPNAKEALEAWATIEKASQSDIEKDAIALHKAHWLIELKAYDDARALLSKPVRTSLEGTRRTLEAKLPKTNT